METASRIAELKENLLRRRRALLREEPLELALLALSATDHHELEEIEAMLARIELGHFGRCEICGGRISSRRLVSRPQTRTCLRCRRTLEACAVVRRTYHLGS